MGARSWGGTGHLMEGPLGEVPDTLWRDLSGGVPDTLWTEGDAPSPGGGEGGGDLEGMGGVGAGLGKDGPGRERRRGREASSVDLEIWSPGIPKCQNPRILTSWSHGVLEPCLPKSPEVWNLCSFEY